MLRKYGVALVGVVLIAGSGHQALADVDVSKRQVRQAMDLSGRSRPVVVLTPTSEQGRRAGAAVAALLRDRGGREVRVTSKAAEGLPGSVNVVALGNMLDNELICRLYWNRYCYADRLWPGSGRVFVRTVFDPYPWHNGGDVVVIAASEPTDLARAADALKQALDAEEGAKGTLSLPFTMAAVPPFKPSKGGPPVRPTLYDFLTEARRYLTTGDETTADRAVEALAKTAALYRKNPKRLPDWPEETSSFEILAAWDAFEEHPRMTGEQRREFLRMFLKWMDGLKHKTSGYAGLGKGDLVAWNHTTFPLLGLYAGSRYFVDYVGVPECERHLAKAKACFLAQARSPKPQEDADSYLIITMRHVIQYCLSEWHLTPFENGVFGRYWDYVVDICDSAGLASGFGDSGVSRDPTLLTRALPTGFWWTRDPGYLWILDHVSGAGKRVRWANPFCRDVTPKRPDRFVGLRVVPLDRQLYAFTQARPFYNEPLQKSPIPADRAVDKIVMRDGWSRAAQYVILDGYGRGKHLHYDTGAIIEYVSRGYRWLLDHDYLTRNTTEHNMLTVLRDGRSTQLVPTMAGLAGTAEGDKCAVVGIEVPRYQGVHWRRSLFWRKGQWLLVVDQARADVAGEYDLDWTWKTEDQGLERLEPDGSFVVRRGTVDPRTRDTSVVADEAASGGKAVLLGQGTSRLALAASVPAGEYHLELYARGVDGSSDSLHVSIDGAKPQAFHVPKRRYGRSSTRFDLTEPTPKVGVGQGQQHVVVVTLRENPPVHLDRLRFVPVAGGHAVEIEAETAPAPTEADLAPMDSDRFTIVTPDAVFARLSRDRPKGIAVPVCRLHQRISARLAAGEGRELANLMFCDRLRQPAGWHVRRAGVGHLVVSDGPTVCLCGQVASGKARLGGGTAMANPRSVLAAETTQLQLGPVRLASAKPFSLALNLSSGAARVRSRTPVDWKVDGSRGRIEPQSAEGQWTSTSIPGWRWDEGLSERWQAYLTNVYRNATRPSATATVSTPTKDAHGQGSTVRWRLDVPGGPSIRRMRLADLDGDGKGELLLAANNQVLAYDTDGKPRWQFACKGSASDVFAAELGEPDGLEVLVADRAGWAYALDAAGKKLHELKFVGLPWNASVGERPYGVLTVGAADLDNDGANEIIVTGVNFELRVYERPWKLRWKDRLVYHGNIDLIARDVDGDGRRELFASDHYGHMHAFAADGRLIARSYSSIGNVMFDVGRFRTDQPWGIVFGSSTGDCIAVDATQPRQKRWRFDNYGYAVRRVLIGSARTPLAGRCYIASASGYVYCLDHAGKVIWQHRLGCDVMNMVACEYGRWSICALDRGGAVWVMTADGRDARQIAGPTLSDARDAPSDETWRHLICLPGRIIVGGRQTIIAYDPPQS